MGPWEADPGEGGLVRGKWCNLQAWGLGVLPSTLSLMTAVSSFPDELPLLRCMLRTELKLTPVAFVRAPHSSMKRHVPAVCTTGSWEVPRTRGPEISCIIHSSCQGWWAPWHPSPTPCSSSPAPHTQFRPHTWEPKGKGTPFLSESQNAFVAKQGPSTQSGRCDSTGQQGRNPPEACL